MDPTRIFMTGCSRSIGAILRDNLIGEGCQVFGVGLGGPDVEQDFLEYKGAPDILEENCDTLIQQACQAMGELPDVLVLNAGMTRIDMLPNHRVSDFDDVMHVNLTVPYALTKAFAKRVADGVKNGPTMYNPSPFKLRRIIYTGSMGTETGLRASYGYACSKAGLEMLCRNVARESAGTLPIMTLLVQPGSIEGTDMIEQVIGDMVRTRGMDEEKAREYVKTGSPLGRMMHPTEVLNMFYFAIFDAPAYMSGSSLKAPGGSGVR